jgi:hypothetical protein
VCRWCSERTSPFGFEGTSNPQQQDNEREAISKTDSTRAPRRLDEELDRRNVGRAALRQPRVLHLDGELAAVVRVRYMDLRERRAGDGRALKRRKQPLGRRAEVVRDDRGDLVVAADGALV